MTLLFWGMLIVVVDVRIGGFDVVMDVTGWLVAALSLGRQWERGPGLGGAVVAAYVGFLGSLIQSANFLDVPEWFLVAVQSVATTVVVYDVCTAVARTATDDPVVVRWSRILRVVAVVVTAVSLVAPPLVFAVPPMVVGGPAGLLLVVAALAVMLCFLVLVWTQRRRFDRPGAVLPSQ
jgi:hypothetical protein